MSRTRIRSDRGGSVLVIVLVVTVMLSLAAYAFTEAMLVDGRATAAYDRALRARLSAESGLELVAAYLGEPTDPVADEGFYHRPDLFQGVLLYDETVGNDFGRFSIVAPVETDPTASRIRNGLMDESGRLHVNGLLLTNTESDSESPSSGSGATGTGGEGAYVLAGSEETTDDLDVAERSRLLALPNMTEAIADSILDWIDEDDVARPFGAESDYYEGLEPAYATANGPFETLDELLLVKDVTPALLYGEDTNRNGLLDPNENDGDLSLPLDNADGVLDVGWSGHLTVYARETNLRVDGTERIDLNQDLLTELYDELEPELGEAGAQFIVAYRMAGPVESEATSQDPLAGLASGDQEAAREFAAAVAKVVASSNGDVTRAGLDLSGGAMFRIDSLFELLDSSVEVQVDGTLTTLDSPWSASDTGDAIPTLFDLVTTFEGEAIDGRINVNQARYETLLSVPGLTPDVADTIAKSALIGPDGEPLTDAALTRSTTAWLVSNGIVDIETMRSLDPYLTARGDVYRAQVIGHFDSGGPIARLEAVLDRSSSPVRVLLVRDLSSLGRGYAHSLLTPATDTEEANP